MKTLKISLVSIFIGLGVVASASVVRNTNEPQPVTLLNAADKSAREIYAQNCARCHGADGRGKTESGETYEVPDIADANWQRRNSNKKITAKIARGGGGMPAFGKKLSAADIQKLVGYVRSLKS